MWRAPKLDNDECCKPFARHSSSHIVVTTKYIEIRSPCRLKNWAYLAERSSMQHRKTLVVSACAGAVILAITAVIFGSRAGVDPAALGILVSAVAASTSIVFASFNAVHQSRTFQEPWLVTFREFQREFWNDPVIAQVRSWICCDEAYRTQLRDILAKRLKGQVTTEEYEVLEKLDRFFALMLRIVYVQVRPVSDEQAKLITGLGYDWWLRSALERFEVSEYARKKWEGVYKWVSNRDKSRSAGNPMRPAAIL